MNSSLHIAYLGKNRSKTHKTSKYYVQKIIEQSKSSDPDLLLISSWLRKAVQVKNKPEIEDLLFVAKTLADFYVNITLPHKQYERNAIEVIDQILKVSKMTILEMACRIQLKFLL